jgi:beta-glucosidase-like glycosyl hydrolase
MLWIFPLRYGRAISASPHTVVDIATAYSKGLNAAGITGTLKHVPGLGRCTANTHHFSASIATGTEEPWALSAMVEAEVQHRNIDFGMT